MKLLASGLRLLRVSRLGIEGVRFILNEQSANKLIISIETE